VHAHAGEHGGNARRIFVGGHSSGGHYAALLAATSDWQRRRGLPADVVRGCLPVSGVFRFDAESGLTMRPRFLGPAGEGDRAAAASPLLRIDAAACAPFLLAWGSRDFAHLIVQGRQMHEALRAPASPLKCSSSKAQTTSKRAWLGPGRIRLARSRQRLDARDTDPNH
jgi:acetyl esterase/lipase